MLPQASQRVRASESESEKRARASHGQYLLPRAALPARCGHARHSLYRHALAHAPLALPRRAPVLQEGGGMRCSGGGVAAAQLQHRRTWGLL